MKRLVLVAALLVAGRTAVAQRTSAVVVDAGPGPIGRYLTALLAKPDTRVLMVDTLTISRDSVYPGDVVVIGDQVTLRGTIHGDLVVIGGNLYIKPGAEIDGAGISIGGGVYGSLLAQVKSGLTRYDDFTFDARRNGSTVELGYRELYSIAGGPKRISLGTGLGLRMPSYDRSQGLSLPIGPTVRLGDGLVLDPRITYRSQIGKLDPSVTGRWKTGRKFWLTGYAGREARTNDDWTSGKLSNSITTLLSGRDYRNWYRATVGEITANRLFETPTTTAVYRIGGRSEEAKSVRPDSFATGGPWTIFGRHSTEGIRRPNPLVPTSTMTSAIAGAGYRWTGGDVKARLDVDVEVPVSISTGQRFIQGTIDGQVGFPTFGLQRYRFEAHGVLTAGDTAPAQRYAYLGGSGTLSTEDILVFGGDELLFLENRYEIPIPRITLPFVGSPTLMFRHILGAAGVQTLPDLTQIIGLRVSLSFGRAQLLMDTKTRKTKFSAGLSLTR